MMHKIQSLHHVLYDSLGSTQDHCKELLQKGSGAEHGLVVRAKIQTNGRGRYGRKWIDLGGREKLGDSLQNGCENVSMTMVLQTNLNATNGCAHNGSGFAALSNERSFFPISLTQLPFLVAVVLGETILACSNLDCNDSANILIQYKWVNDILFNQLKVAGILVEYLDSGYLLVGIGVNVISFPPQSSLEESNTKNIGATSLFAAGVKVSAERFVKVFSDKFVDIYNDWLQNGFGFVKRSWLKRAFCFEELVEVKTVEGIYRGNFIGIDNDGRMLLKIHNNQIKTIAEGSMRKII